MISTQTFPLFSLTPLSSPFTLLHVLATRPCTPGRAPTLCTRNHGIRYLSARSRWLLSKEVSGIYGVYVCAVPEIITCTPLGAGTRETFYPLQFDTHFLAQFKSVGNQDNLISRDEFIEYYTNVSASIDHDDYFELMLNPD